MADYKFSQVPAEKNIKRSQFNRSYRHSTDLNAGYLVPFHIDEVLPADTCTIHTSVLCRMATPIHPVMDNCYLDLWYFYVPTRILWEHWKEFNGENRTTFWEQPAVYTIPQITSPSPTGWNINTIADYLGIPTGKVVSVNALPFRAYSLIWNEFFRDQNHQVPIFINYTDSTVSGSNGSDYPVDAGLGGVPAPVAKDHDYFTSCLPAPQKGPSVAVPIGSGEIPVYTNNERVPLVDYQDGKSWSGQGMYLSSYSGMSSTTTNWNFFANYLDPLGGGNKPYPETKTSSSGTSASGTNWVTPVNLWANLRMGNVAGVNINTLRQAFQVQKMYERDARGGSRYIEILLSHFGVVSPDSRQQRPEYLGGKRVPINITQIEQTSSTIEGSPLATTSAYSLTIDKSGSFTKSFTEHGYILGLCAVRAQQTYQQGIERLFSRRNRTDFYMPVFANISEQPVYNREIYVQGNNVVNSNGVVDDQVFGYQEAWADYRYKPNRVSGNMRSSSPVTLDSWHYAQNFSALPVLSDNFIRETRANIDRTIEYTSEQTTQFIADFYIDCKMSRPMPLYSVPGLIDHN